jgi:hypothetical protein
MSVECSNCGEQVPYAGQVCPFCGHDKSDDKRSAWTQFISGLVGLAIGFMTFDNVLFALLCFFPGYFAGAVYGLFASGKKKPPQAPVAPPTPRAATNDTVENKLAQLKKMHEQGLLTAEEYAAKKADVLAKF